MCLTQNLAHSVCSVILVAAIIIRRKKYKSTETVWKQNWEYGWQKERDGFLSQVLKDRRSMGQNGEKIGKMVDRNSRQKQ